MDREQLRDWLEQGLSLEQIGLLVNRDPSTVGYWVNKHGLVANGRDKHASRGGLRKDQLEALVLRGETLASIADRFRVSISTVRYWIGRYDLPQPRKARRSAVEQALRDGRRTVIARCKRHGETEFALVGSARRPRCKRCRAEAVIRRRRKVKRILVEEAGAQCQICGYDKSFVALEFHHVDPNQKAFGVAHRGITRAIAEVREEARKCVLLCANCHAEVEAGVATLPAT